MQRQSLLTQPAPHVLLLPAVGQDKNVTAIRILRRHMRYIEHSSLCGKDASAALKELGIVCECPVLPAACDLLRLRVQGHHTTAGESSDVRFSLLVEHQVPAHDAARPSY
jgi:hypothetical protein